MRKYLFIILLLSLIFSVNPKKPNNTVPPAKHARSEWLSPVGIQPMNQTNIPPINTKQPTERDNGLVRIHPPNTPQDHDLRDRDCPDGNIDCWDLSYMNEADSYYYLSSGGENDTFAVVFQPSFPCIVQEVYMQWFSAGTVTAFGADYGSASEISPNGDCYDIPGGSTNLSPIGTIRTTPTENYISEYISDWSEGAQLDIGGSFQVGYEDNQVSQFVIGLVKHGDTPQPLAMNNEVTGRTETFTWFGGPWNADDPGLWGPYNQIIELMMLVRVTPTCWDEAPDCWNYGNLSNTYATSDIRPVNFGCFDSMCTGDNGITEDDDIILHYYLDGILLNTQNIMDAIPIDVDEFGNGVYQFEIDYTGYPNGEISYYLSINENGMIGQTYPRYFTIKAPVNPDADLLLIDDGASEYYLGGYEQVAQQNGYVYEYWNTNQNHGIDASVINHGWSNIIVYGWGNSTLPVLGSELDPGYGEFISNGGNLMLIDQDWFYGHGLYSYPVELSFGPGDPAYDWFGITGAISDPDIDNEQSNGGDGDTMLVSLLPNLTDIELHHSIYTTANWGDFLTPGTAESVYQGMNTGEIMGVRQDNGMNKTALFSFMADASVDTTEDGSYYYTQEFYDFVTYFLDWFEIDSPPHAEIISGPNEYVFNDTGQEVQAEISDAQGDPFTATLEYSVDDLDWFSVEMIEVQVGVYSGIIPAQISGDHVQYRVATTDVDGSYFTPIQTYFVYAPSSDVLFVLNNEMEDNNFPGAYYFYDAFNTGDLWMWPDFWTSGVTADLLELYNIVFEITSTDTWSDFTDHYDIIHAWLNEGGKGYFLAGDETFGLMNSTWTDEDFAPGSFFNDMGVSHSYNDIAAGGVSELTAIDGDFISGDLHDGVIALGDNSVLMYDPSYEIETTNYLDGIEPTEEAIPIMFDNVSGHVIGVYKPWSNGNRTVFCGFDPLSLNSSPTYVWWGASESGITKKSLDWFFQSDCSTGDLNGDGLVNVLDVVQAVACILGTVEDGACGCDFNFIVPFDVLDIVILLGWILSG
ncbi:MAG: hypothetical protein HQ510_12850 [Candidatus Marinimicrobia bacterium]|nr:hypothetical protein [Candidatus Neomarinimicrobiota bacterium]